MKELPLSFITVTLLSSMPAGSTSTQELSEQKETLVAIVKVSDYFMRKYAGYTLPSFFGRTRLSNIWTRGVYYGGLITLCSIYPREDYYSHTYGRANFHKWGMRNGNTTRNADDQCYGQAYIDLCNMCPSDPNMIRNIKASIDMIVSIPQINDRDWVDAIQMATPAYARFGKMIGEQKYYDRMWDLYSYTRNTEGEAGTCNAKGGLQWRDQDFSPSCKEPNGKNCYWSRGNGWVYAALVHVLDEIPTDETYCQDYIDDFLTMSKASKQCQRIDGLQNVGLHNESNFGGKETSGITLLVYGMARGTRNGLFDRKKYLPVVLKIWSVTVREAVHLDGFLGCVQGTGREPKDRQPITYKSVPDFKGYGVGCLLLAGTEVYKLK